MVSHNWTTPHFESYKVSCRGYRGNMHAKFEVLALSNLELFAFNVHNFLQSHDPFHTPFPEILRVM